uniref:Uncharacterized protein n=1 Tax=Arundo donax TaxID=35708 RepID=A0A0A9RWQ0_ARUDO
MRGRPSGSAVCRAGGGTCGRPRPSSPCGPATSGLRSSVTCCCSSVTARCRCARSACTARTGNASIITSAGGCAMP